jgi:phosphatidylserine decarboxylase
MFGYILPGVLLALGTTLLLAWKWQLGVRRMAILVVLLAILPSLLMIYLTSVISIVAVLQSGLVWFLTEVAVFVFLAYRFYRDPQRRPPQRDDVIVSPADGKIIYIRESREGMLPISTKYGHQYPLQELTKTSFFSQDAVVIGISMSFLDVHINRSPMAGRVTLRRHFPGRFGSLRRPEMVFENERATTIIKRGEIQVAVVQIASRLVRQIAAFVEENQDVTLGQRIGIIRFGSQVDLVLPKRRDLKLKVHIGERVKAGQSIIAILESEKSMQLVEESFSIRIEM